jgi:hypothetical protein
MLGVFDVFLTDPTREEEEADFHLWHSVRAYGDQIDNVRDGDHTSVYAIDPSECCGPLLTAYTRMMCMLHKRMCVAPVSNVRLEYGLIVRRPNTDTAPIHRDGGYGIVLLYLQTAPGPTIYGTTYNREQHPEGLASFLVKCGSMLYLDPDVWHCTPGNRTDDPVMLLYVQARKCFYDGV